MVDGLSSTRVAELMSGLMSLVSMGMEEEEKEVSGVLSGLRSDPSELSELW